MSRTERLKPQWCGVEAQVTRAELARQAIERCRELARVSDTADGTTRTFLSPATRGAHALVHSWMMRVGLSTRTDDIGNVRGWRSGATPAAPVLLLFSHIDTVPNAGAFDGPLGVTVALAALEMLQAEPLPFAVEVIAFSEEEGIRFSFPFLSSRAAVGELDDALLERADAGGTSVAQAIREFGLDPTKISDAARLATNVFAALEVHIEQGPVLEAEDAAVAVVETIVGQSRLRLTFTGQANHAGTTPMAMRRDALAAAAEWIVAVEKFALDHRQLVATVGSILPQPGTVNVVAGTVHCTLDVRHPSDASRHAAVATLVTQAEHAGAKRGVNVRATTTSEQRSVPMDPALTARLRDCVEAEGYGGRSMFSGAGHDAMVVAPHVPTAMLFVRSPGGISHHPDESVRLKDVEAAIACVCRFVRELR